MRLLLLDEQVHSGLTTFVRFSVKVVSCVCSPWQTSWEPPLHSHDGSGLMLRLLCRLIGIRVGIATNEVMKPGMPTCLLCQSPACLLPVPCMFCPLVRMFCFFFSYLPALLSMCRSPMHVFLDIFFEAPCRVFQHPFRVDAGT